jgi:hypothetical protein
LVAARACAAPEGKGGCVVGGKGLTALRPLPPPLVMGALALARWGTRADGPPHPQAVPLAGAARMWLAVSAAGSMNGCAVQAESQQAEAQVAQQVFEQSVSGMTCAPPRPVETPPTQPSPAPTAHSALSPDRRAHHHAGSAAACRYLERLAAGVPAGVAPQKPPQLPQARPAALYHVQQLGVRAADLTGVGVWWLADAAR